MGQEYQTGQDFVVQFPSHSDSHSHQKHAVGIQVDPQLDAVDDLLSGPLRDPKIGDQGHDRDSKEPVGRVRVDSYQCPPPMSPPPLASFTGPKRSQTGEWPE